MSDLRLLELMSSVTPCGSEAVLPGGHIIKCTRDKGHEFHHRCTIEPAANRSCTIPDLTVIWDNQDAPRDDSDIPF